MTPFTKFVMAILTFSLIALLVGIGFYQVDSSYHVGPNSRPLSTRSNDRPIIGVLTQEYFGGFKGYGNNHSYIAASYVKWVESAGGRVVPILLDQKEDYYRYL